MPRSHLLPYEQLLAATFLRKVTECWGWARKSSFPIGCSDRLRHSHAKGAGDSTAMPRGLGTAQPCGAERWGPGAAQCGLLTSQPSSSAVTNLLKGSYRKEGGGLFSRVSCDRTRGNGFKLKEGRFRLHVWKKFLTVRVVRHWNRLPRGVVEAPSLETFWI